MRLHITHHAVARMGLCHQDLLPYVPKQVDVPLTEAQAWKLLVKLTGPLLIGLFRGSHALLPEAVQREKAGKYHTPDYHVFDYKAGDLFTLILDGEFLRLVTVVKLEREKKSRLEENERPEVDFRMITELSLPYDCETQDHRLTSIELPSGVRASVFFGQGKRV